MVSRNKHSNPRAVGGGRSRRYDRRAHRKAGARSYAPEWSDAAAAAVLSALQAKSSGNRKVSQFCDTWLLTADTDASFVHELKLSPADRDVTTSILAVHAARARAGQQEGKLRAIVKAFLKPLRERKGARHEVGELEVEPADSGPATFHAWLSRHPHKERLRDITTCERITKGLKSWPLTWLRKRGVICYERADARIQRERGGRADAAFLRGVVKFTELATATANSSDHYVLLAPGKEPRFLTVQEVMRAFAIPSGGSLWKALIKPSGLLSAPQAVSCLGRSVHTGVARQLVRQLLKDGTLSEGLTYGSAFSGVDTFAAAVEAELHGKWDYKFASEANRTVRQALLHAWGPHGLTEAACPLSAMSATAKGAPTVDLYVTTPECNDHSKRNHSRNATDQNTSTKDFWDSLEYVRTQRPRTVVVENVCEPSAVGPMTGLLSRLEGYTIHTGKMDPRTTAKMPISRERQFWVLRLA